MASDPRRRHLVKTEDNPIETSNVNQNKSGSILFEGDDAMDDDEDLFDSSEPIQNEPQQPHIPPSAGSASDVPDSKGGGSMSYYSNGVENYGNTDVQGSML
eukprot:CAMPEP_0197191522 /NCGR_PEP_ID=MMETSP1423-20130617/23553_1 /TAXON_ID=476441 /ORGANISM="Pseudo-nitzschia heimii, Strain UNC1101" /LENGTH=100 /DNA_ID=CAMNT_0042644185 /DNA_START=124 /DNA_END=423 /DNA_ORIENTATION=+